ncbi:F-box only protein 33 [Lampetra fluviatilis]
MAMALAPCGHRVDASALPCEIIVHVLSFLPPRDRLAASSVCSRWRACLFQPSLWPALRLRVGAATAGGGGSGGGGATSVVSGGAIGGGGGGDDALSGATFLSGRCGSFVREFSLSFEHLARGGLESSSWDWDGGGGGGGGGGGDGDGGSIGGNAGANTISNNTNNNNNSSSTVGGGGAGGCCSVTALLQSHVDGAAEVLRSLRNNRNLERLALLGDSVIDVAGSLQPIAGGTGPSAAIDPDGERTEELQSLVREILRNCKRLRSLSLAFMLEVATPELLPSLPETSLASLRHLALLRLHGGRLTPGPDADTSAIPLLRPPEAGRMRNLRCLALDLADFTAELAQALARRAESPGAVPLVRISLLLHNQHPRAGKSLESMPQDSDWSLLTAGNTALRVYLLAVGVGSDLLLRVLRPALPLERLHLDGCPGLSAAVLDLVSRQYGRTLAQAVLVREACEPASASSITQLFPDLSEGQHEDPLVLLAWKCNRLSRLTIHGYVMWADNLVAIARLRGACLRVLEVTEESLDFDPEAFLHVQMVIGDPPVLTTTTPATAGCSLDVMGALVDEVSMALGRPWSPTPPEQRLDVFNQPTWTFCREVESFGE